MSREWGPVGRAMIPVRNFVYLIALLALPALFFFILFSTVTGCFTGKSFISTVNSNFGSQGTSAKERYEQLRFIKGIKRPDEW